MQTQSKNERQAEISTALTDIAHNLHPQDVLEIFFRHGQRVKGEDRMTPEGEAQIEQAVWRIKQEILVPTERSAGLILTSGLTRATQAAKIAKDVLGAKHLMPVEDKGLSPYATIKQVWPEDGLNSLLAEMEGIRATNDTIGHALEISEYARQGQQIVEQMILRLAAIGQRTIVGIGHSPWVHLRCNPTTRYCMEEAEAAVYIVRRGQIVLARTLLGPIVGGR